MKKLSLSKFLIILLLITVIFNITGCAKKPTEENAANVSNDETLVVRLEGGDWGFPSPFAHYSRGPGMSKMRLIYDSLLEKGKNGLIPWLAKDWDISPDGTEYTFIFRSQMA